ncbi:MAG: cofactor-independent phosphoglycerate mutase [Candidatus Omnitrophica bacterium]|nr:cofactor-independent phosphoglycerate mutase [Candidatus Omnitrophota bacterium]
MKFIILVPDGAADEPCAQLDGKTPLEAARTAHMDDMAHNGLCGLVKTIPDGLAPGSDVGNLALLGYDPQVNFSGRAPLEAANMGVILKTDEVAFRCNLVTVIDGIMTDYSAGHIDSEEARNLIEDLQRAIDWPDVRFYAGKGYRHLMVIKSLNVQKLAAIKTIPPHDIPGQPIAGHLPSGPQSEVLLTLMEKSRKILEGHQINKVRADLKDSPANQIWLWGQGLKPNLPLFKERWNLTGAVISAVDLVNGIGRLAGLKVIFVPGANGYYDTNYKGKAEYALDALKDHDFVYVHVEATDEAGHNGDLKMKMESIERFDRDVVGTILNRYGQNDDARILVLPDHPTPVAKRTHTSAPVPFVMFGRGIKPNGAAQYGETAAAKNGLKFQSGQEMMRYFLKMT